MLVIIPNQDNWQLNISASGPGNVFPGSACVFEMFVKMDGDTAEQNIFTEVI